MKKVVLVLMALAVCVFAVAFLIGDFSPVSVLQAHGVHSYAAEGAALIALRTDYDGIVAKAAAKLKEIGDDTPADKVTAIEAEHATLIAKAEEIKTKMAVEEQREKNEPKQKPWAAAFFASAEASTVTLADLNKIVMECSTHDQAKDKLIDAMASAGDGDKPGVRTPVTLDAHDKFVTGATRGVIARISMFNEKGKPGKDAEVNEFTGMTLRELARAALVNGGRGNIPRDPMMMIGSALQPIIMAGAQSTSDFVNVLANVANKSMMKGFDESPETFQLWTSVGTLTDFKIAKRVDLGLFPSLDEVDEGAEYKYGSMSDRGVDLVLATYGKLFAISRQAIINDDLSAFTKVPMKMGAAAKRTVGNLVYAIVTGNVNAPDGIALFHTTHKNLATGGGSALSATSADAGRAAMGKQTDPDSIKQGLNIRPAYMLVPIALQGTANQLMQSQAEPGQENPAVANRVANMAQIVADARLDVASATAWYLAADPNAYDTIEVSYLNGVQTPTLEQKEGWNVDGVEFKVRHDAASTLLDFRGFYKGAGA